VFISLFFPELVVYFVCKLLLTLVENNNDDNIIKKNKKKKRYTCIIYRVLYTGMLL